MNTIICEESLTLGRAASNWVQDRVRRHQAKSIFIPAGQTPIPLYQLWEKEKPDFLKGLAFLQIDEVLTGSQKGVFKDFFQQHLPSFRNQIRYIEAAEHVADLAILGLGVNGHVAFHEPGIDNQFYSGCVQLTSKTCEYLKLEPNTWGLTYGVGAFVRCKSVMMTVTGKGKREVLARLLREDRELPATALLHHQDLTLLADREALPEGPSKK